MNRTLKVTEDDRWVETWDDAVKTWSEAQNTFARGIPDKLPQVNTIRARVSEILGAQTSS